jgi:hypothetical protein
MAALEIGAAQDVVSERAGEATEARGSERTQAEHGARRLPFQAPATRIFVSQVLLHGFTTFLTRNCTLPLPYFTVESLEWGRHFSIRTVLRALCNYTTAKSPYTVGGGGPFFHPLSSICEFSSIWHFFVHYESMIHQFFIHPVTVTMVHNIWWFWCIVINAIESFIVTN